MVISVCCDNSFASSKKIVLKKQEDHVKNSFHHQPPSDFLLFFSFILRKIIVSVVLLSQSRSLKNFETITGDISCARETWSFQKKCSFHMKELSVWVCKVIEKIVKNHLLYRLDIFQDLFPFSMFSKKTLENLEVIDTS